MDDPNLIEEVRQCEDRLGSIERNTAILRTRLLSICSNLDAAERAKLREHVHAVSLLCAHTLRRYGNPYTGRPHNHAGAIQHTGNVGNAAGIHESKPDDAAV